MSNFYSFSLSYPHSIKLFFTFHLFCLFVCEENQFWLPKCYFWISPKLSWPFDYQKKKWVLGDVTTWCSGRSTRLRSRMCVLLTTVPSSLFKLRSFSTLTFLGTPKQYRLKAKVTWGWSGPQGKKQLTWLWTSRTWLVKDRILVRGR